MGSDYCNRQAGGGVGTALASVSEEEEEEERGMAIAQVGQARD